MLVYQNEDETHSLRPHVVYQSGKILEVVLVHREIHLPLHVVDVGILHILCERKSYIMIKT